MGCESIDGQLVARTDPKLEKLLEKFVTVRCVQMGGVDLGLFQFDPLLSWSVFLMNADKTIYGRFGMAHENAKRSKKDSNTNHSIQGLMAAMEGALDLHRQYTADAAAMKKVLALKRGDPWPWTYAEKTPIAKRYKRHERIKGKDTKGCVHCHEVQRLMIDSYFLTKRAVTDDMLWMYPHPHWVGLTMSKDHRGLVTKVREGSRAAIAGLRAGDVIETMNDQPVLSPADIVWVLHRTPDEGAKIPLVLQRNGKTTRATLGLRNQWRREADFAWRYRVAGYAMWLWGGATYRDHKDGVLVAAHPPWWFKKFNKDAKQALKPRDVIVAVDGEATQGPRRRAWTRSTFLAYLMRDKKPGSTVALKVRRGEGTIDVTFKLPKPRPEVLGH